jgi:hypothetical protein
MMRTMMMQSFTLLSRTKGITRRGIGSWGIDWWGIGCWGIDWWAIAYIGIAWSAKKF